MSMSSKKPITVPNKKLPKKLKDSNAPKRPITSFIAFSMSERPKIIADLGLQSLAEIGKELGRRWAQLDSETKAEYERASKASQEKFEEEMKNYRPSEEFLRKKAMLEAKSSEVPTVSLYSPSNYFTFLFNTWREIHLSQPNLSAKDIQDQIWQRWISAGNLEGNETGEMISAPGSKGMIKSKKARDPCAPKKPLSAYFLYMESVRTELVSNMPQLSHKEVIAELGRRWTAADDAARAPFIELHRQSKAEYLVALEKYKTGHRQDVMELANTAEIVQQGAQGDIVDNKEAEMEVDGPV